MSNPKPTPTKNLNIGGIRTANWNVRDNLCTITVPDDQYRFEDLELFWKNADWLNISISSKGVNLASGEKVREYKLIGQIEAVQRVKDGSLIRISYPDPPEIITHNLDGGTSEKH